jgi:protein-tyrosine-phosphatase
LPAGAADLPGAVLFACSRNAVRSPMAAAILRYLAGTRIYVNSAGVRAGEADPFAIVVMDEIGIDISAHRPTAFADLPDISFDQIVTLSPEAHHTALELASTYAIDVEYWPTPDPTMTSGNREQILSAYRGVRDGLFRRIKQRFPVAGAPNV